MNDKKLKLTRQICQKADALALEYLEGLEEKINDQDIDQEGRLKAFCEIDKVLKIAKQYSDRLLFAEGKDTENIGVGGMPFQVVITKTYEKDDRGQTTDDSSQESE